MIRYLYGFGHDILHCAGPPHRRKEVPKTDITAPVSKTDITGLASKTDITDQLKNLAFKTDIIGLAKRQVHHVWWFG